MRTTKAAILSKIKEPLEITELIIPGLKPGQVLVKLSYSGICHSQLNEMRGLKGEDKFLPHTLGHEGSGIVMEVGTEVEKVKKGNHVVLTWIKGSGKETPATQYHRHDGSVVNSGAISTFMEYAVISENRLVPIPEEMPLKEAALLGCAIPTGAGIVLNTARIKNGNSVAIFGVGGIGISALLAAKMMGAAMIVAIDIHEQKLHRIKKIGATHIINASKQDAYETLRTITDGQGVDFAIEAAGQRITMETAFNSVRDNGGMCILAGNLPLGQHISIDPLNLIKGKRIVGTWGGETDTDRDVPIYVDHFLSDRFNLSFFASDIYRIDNINDSFNDLASGKVDRPLIEFS